MYYFSCIGRPSSPDHLDHLLATLFILLSILYLSMQDVILEADFDVNDSLLSSLLEKMNSISDLYLFPRNQLVPSLTHFFHISVSSIVDCAQASASHWNTYQPYLFSSRHHPPSINSYPILSSLSSLQHQNSPLFIPPATELWNCLPLHIRISSSLSTLKKHFQPILP